MQILLIVDDYLPHSEKVAALMMHQLAQEFKISGHNIIVLTPTHAIGNTTEIKVLDGIEVVYFKTGEIKNTGKIKRAINETLLSVKALSATGKYFQDKKIDAIVYYSPSIFWGYLVGSLKKSWDCKAYLILRDIFPQWTVDNGLMSTKSPVYWYFKFFEALNYKNADRIGVMSPSNLAFFQSVKKNTSKFEVLYNWSSISDIPVVSDKHRKEHRLLNKIVLFYGGNIGHAQKMIFLVDLAKKFKGNDNVHFLFVGKGDEVELILSEQKNYELKNITYLPSVDQRTYFEMLNEFDIGLFSLHPDHKTHNFPGKLLGYMNYSKPVLGCVNQGNDLKEIVNDAKAGVIVNSGEEDSLYNAALMLIESGELRKSMGENGRLLLETQFSIKKAASQILDSFV